MKTMSETLYSCGVAESEQKTQARDQPRLLETRDQRIRRKIVEIAKMHCVSFDDILAHRRAKPIVAARWAAMRAVAAAEPKMTCTQLGKAFKRHHTAVLYALRRTKRAKTRAACL